MNKQKQSMCAYVYVCASVPVCGLSAYATGIFEVEDNLFRCYQILTLKSETES